MNNNIKDSINLIVSGDIMLGGSLSAELEKEKFSHLKNDFQDADIVFGNLEAPFSNEGQSQENKIVLSQPKEAAELIDYLGFNILSLGNNHIMDYGEKGLDETFRILNDNNIQYVGAGNDLSQARKPAEFTINGIKTVLLGYTIQSTEESNDLLYAKEKKKGLAPFDMDIIREDINQAKANGANIVIVSLHWGQEKYHYPFPEQREQAYEIIDTGADIIAGHHSHLIQGIERYKKGVIVYSLGNFIFGEFMMPNGCIQKWGDRYRLSAYINFNLAKKGVLDYDVVPLWIGKDLIPRKTEKKAHLRALKRYSARISDVNYEGKFQHIVCIEKIDIVLDKIKRKIFRHGL
ncbi:MAG: CapA family protein [PVC group bacterium]|nr:CapA family protein [PVC group bacterium]